MSIMSPDTSRETATLVTDGCNNNQMVQHVVQHAVQQIRIW